MIPDRLLTYILTVLTVGLLAGSIMAEAAIEPPEAASSYARGRRLLREGNWLGAAEVFEQLSGMYPQSASQPLFVFHRAKAHYYAREYSKATAGFSFFLSRFPDAPEVPHAHFFLGNSYYRSGSVNRAMRQYLAAFSASGDQRLTRLASEALVGLFENAGAITVGQADFANVPADRRCDLIRQIAPALASHGRLSLADELLRECGEALDPAAITTPRAGGGNTIEIAMILPLSGDLQDFGQEVYNGAVIAAELYRAESGRSLSLIPFDSKGDPIDAARIVSEVSNSGATAAIGPLTSDEAAVASARLYQSGLPMIVPAATEAGFTRLAETAFQLSPNVELQGIRMADYAVKTLGAQTAAVISSTSNDYLRMTRAFSHRFEQLGGVIIATEYYRVRDKDFGPYIRDIKGILHGAILDSVYYIDERGDTIDVDGLSASVDCLFLPGSSEQVRLLLPQINFYNLRGQYLGTDGWGDEAIYRLGDDVTRRAIFPSPFLPKRPTDEAIRFAAAYDTRFGTRPERLARLGYDAVRLIVLAAGAGASSRDEIAEYLRRVTGYPGATGEITFGPNHENIELPLYRIEEGAPVPLDRVTDTTEPGLEP